MEECNTYRIIKSRHVTFNENEFLGAPGLEDISEDEVSDDDTDSIMSEYQFENDLKAAQLDDTSIQVDNKHEPENNQL